MWICINITFWNGLNLVLNSSRIYHLKKTFRIYHPKICHFCVLTILRHSTWKTANAERDFLWIPLVCLKTAAKRNSTVINPLPGDVINWGRSTLGPGGETWSWPHTQTCFGENYRYLPPILLRAQSSFLETIYSPLRSLHPPSLSSIKVVVNI